MSSRVAKDSWCSLAQSFLVLVCLKFSMWQCVLYPSLALNQQYDTLLFQTSLLNKVFLISHLKHALFAVVRNLTGFAPKIWHYFRQSIDELRSRQPLFGFALFENYKKWASRELLCVRYWFTSRATTRTTQMWGAQSTLDVLINSLLLYFHLTFGETNKLARENCT